MKNLFTLLLTFTLLMTVQLATAQVKTTSSGGGTAPIKYIDSTITKKGNNDHGIYKINLYRSDRDYKNGLYPVNAKKQQYENIHVILDEGDVLYIDLHLSLGGSANLYNVANNQLKPVKIILIDTANGAYKFEYYAATGGDYLLKILSKPREDLYEYDIKSIIATTASAKLSSTDTSFCDKLKFLLRQKLTNYFLFRGSAIKDTTMDYFDKTKISDINYKTPVILMPNSYGEPVISYRIENHENTYVIVFTFNSRSENQTFKENLVKNILSCLDGWKMKANEDNTYFSFSEKDPAFFFGIEYNSANGITELSL